MCTRLHAVRPYRPGSHRIGAFRASSAPFLYANAHAWREAAGRELPPGQPILSEDRFGASSSSCVKNEKWKTIKFPMIRPGLPAKLDNTAEIHSSSSTPSGQKASPNVATSFPKKPMQFMDNRDRDTSKFGTWKAARLPTLNASMN